ncbi:uncharacterized protein LOC127289935 [Leptopilina boulardi]|uniref:uncharacterized protein LOC127289935 n=1 Tax=Leptopilina boulardi TaxID=63433 RepID=UPI0021F546DA|nr:uncharacterized protein LOC127289935 [Leptopilina boulardi]
MTSVDSGVETGNDSNDSLVAQHENIPAGQASVSTSAFMSTAGNKMEDEEIQCDPIPTNLDAIASIHSHFISTDQVRRSRRKRHPHLKHYLTSRNNISFSNIPGTSGPLTFHPSEFFMSPSESRITEDKMEDKKDENDCDTFSLNLEALASIHPHLKHYLTSRNNISLGNIPGTSDPLTFHPSERVVMTTTTSGNKVEDEEKQSDTFSLNLEALASIHPHLKHYLTSRNNISLPGTSEPLTFHPSETVFMTTTTTSGNKGEDEEKKSDLILTNHSEIVSIHPHLKHYNNSTNTNISLSNRPGTSGPLPVYAAQSLQPFVASEMFFTPTTMCSNQLLSTVEFIKSIRRRAGPPFSIESNSHQANCFKPKMRIFRGRHHCITGKEFQGPLKERKMRMAAATNNVEVMRRLLETGISPNNKDGQQRTPLHLASCRGYTEIVRLLLDHGADPNQRDCIGNTPLHLATVTSKIAVVTLLLKAGTDVLSSDKHGHNPLQIAQTKLKLLQNCHGSDMIKIKEEVHNIVDMLLAYLEKQKNAQEQVENLSNFYSRLSLSNTSNQIQDDVRDLLANLNSLSLTS